MSEPYSRYEIEALLARDPNALPRRGQYCPRCQSYIPKFAELPTDAELELKRRIKEGRVGGATAVWQELRARTGCSTLWAKLWLIHLDGPHQAESPPIPCPYCGKLLKTAKAQQCFACGADWHNKTPTA